MTYGPFSVSVGFFPLGTEQIVPSISLRSRLCRLQAAPAPPSSGLRKLTGLNQVNEQIPFVLG